MLILKIKIKFQKLKLQMVSVHKLLRVTGWQLVYVAVFLHVAQLILRDTVLLIQCLILDI
jgi:hypothetical protein